MPKKRIMIRFLFYPDYIMIFHKPNLYLLLHPMKNHNIQSVILTLVILMLVSFDASSFSHLYEGDIRQPIQTDSVSLTHHHQNVSTDFYSQINSFSISISTFLSGLHVCPLEQAILDPCFSSIWQPPKKLS